uniref:Integrase core domain containing protein n=1 Tax=Solanum tuberosum TaxID=4113 RepID=M1DK47_SOLTU
MSGSESAHASGSESAQAARSSAKSATGSGENDQAASSDEATSSESIPTPRNDDPTPVAGEINRWDSGVLIWHCDKLVHPTGGLDIGHIRDDANVAAPRREPQVEVPPLGADLADTMGQEGLAPTHAKGKQHRSHRTEEEKAQKRQRRGIELCPVAKVQPVLRDVVSTTDGVVRLIESTTEGATIADVGTTEGAPTIVPAGYGKPDAPSC